MCFSLFFFFLLRVCFGYCQRCQRHQLYITFLLTLSLSFIPFCAPNLIIVCVRAKSLRTKVNVLFIQWVQWSTTHTHTHTLVIWQLLISGSGYIHQAAIIPAAIVIAVTTNRTCILKINQSRWQHRIRWWREIRIKQYNLNASVRLCADQSRPTQTNKQLSKQNNNINIIIIIITCTEHMGKYGMVFIVQKKQKEKKQHSRARKQHWKRVDFYAIYSSKFIIICTYTWTQAHANMPWCVTVCKL